MPPFCELRTEGLYLPRENLSPWPVFLIYPVVFVDPMERVEDAIQREVEEELGVHVNEMQFLASFPNEYIYKNISYFTSDLAFVCPMNDLSQLTPSDDVADAILIQPREIDFDTISFPSIVNILKTYISQL